MGSAKGFSAKFLAALDHCKQMVTLDPQAISSRILYNIFTIFLKTGVEMYSSNDDYRISKCFHMITLFHHRCIDN